MIKQYMRLTGREYSCDEAVRHYCILEHLAKSPRSKAAILPKHQYKKRIHTEMSTHLPRGRGLLLTFSFLSKRWMKINPIEVRTIP